MHGLNQVCLYTITGKMDVVYVQEFVRRIAHKVINHRTVEVAHLAPPTSSTYSEGPIAHDTKRSAHELKPYFSPGYEYMVRGNFRLEEEMQEAALKRMVEEFKVLVAQRNPDFFIKDLSLATIEDLSTKYAESMGGDACGMHLNLSKYQQFFAIASPEDFIFYRATIQNPANPYPEVVGKLVDLRPDRWVMGRYDNLEYLKELSAKANYLPGTTK